MNWTHDRPTKPGEYWLSLPPDDRQSMPRVRPAYVYESRRCMVTLNFDGYAQEAEAIAELWESTL